MTNPTDEIGNPIFEGCLATYDHAAGSISGTVICFEDDYVLLETMDGVIKVASEDILMDTDDSEYQCCLRFQKGEGDE